MKKRIFFQILLPLMALVLVVPGCFKSVDDHKCHTLADCPSDSLSCEQGYCFVDQPQCTTNKTDGCCKTGGERSQDSDCILHEVDLQSAIRDVTSKPALFGKPVAGAGSLYIEAGTDADLVMIVVDQNNKVFHKGCLSTLKKPLSPSTLQNFAFSPLTPSTLQGYTLFPLDVAFGMWGPGNRFLFTSKTAAVVQAIGYASHGTVTFYAATMKQRVVTIGVDGTVSDPGIQTSGNVWLDTWHAKALLTICDDNACRAFDLTGKPADPAKLFAIRLERPTTAAVQLTDNYLWVPSGKGLDLYSLKTYQRTITINFSDDIKSVVMAGPDSLWVVTSGAVARVDANGTKVDVPGAKGSTCGIEACGGLAVLGDKTGLYNGTGWSWTMDMTRLDQSDRPLADTGMVIWGARLAYVSQGRFLTGIPFTCR